MFDLTRACEMAYKHFEKTKELKGIHEIFDIGESWLFFGRDDPPDIPVYGNTPIAVNKQTGEGYYFCVSDPNNIDSFMKAKPIEVPEKYKLQCHQ